MAFNPDSISSAQINDLRAAAEHAWGDDTCHESFIGHPQPSAGQCFVTSAWLRDRLGGHVGVKGGHYFWVSPDKRYVIDLSGDQFAYPPVDPSVEGMQLDDDDEPWQLDPHQKTWRPGPVMYKRSDHPLYKGLRIVDTTADGAAARVKRFSQRADAYLNGSHTSSYKHSGLLGSEPYPGSTPQAQEDYDLSGPSPLGPVVHDEPDYNPSSTLQEYRFVVGNGQLHVSPVHEHQELLEHSGAHGDGPTAVGYAEVQQGHVLWSVESNIALRGLSELLKEYSEHVGWHWDGMTDTRGNILHDDFGPKQSMWYKTRPDGHLVLSHTPLPHGKRITIEGKTAHVREVNDALQEWASDFGYKLAEYPGGGNMEDMIKVRPNLELFNRGLDDIHPQDRNMDLTPHGDFVCGTCGQGFPALNELTLHRREDHENYDTEPIEDGHFPWPGDFNPSQQNPGFGTNPLPNGGATIAKVLPFHTASDLRRAGWNETTIASYGWSHPDAQYYGAFHRGQLIAYAGVKNNLVFVHHAHTLWALGDLLNTIKLHYPGASVVSHSPTDDAALRHLGMINTKGFQFTAAAGKMPKDMIEAAIPFIYDIHGDKDHKMGKISIGYAGQKTHEIGGKFTPGGIVEGYYEPGGRVVFVSTTNAPYTVRQFAQLWYHQFPQMEITSVEMEDAEGKTHKLAGRSWVNDVTDWGDSGSGSPTVGNDDWDRGIAPSTQTAVNHAGQIPGDEAFAGDIGQYQDNPNRGVNPSYTGVTDTGRNVYIKPEGAFHDNDLAHERAAFGMARAIGIHMPHTVARYVNAPLSPEHQVPAIVQEAVPGAKPLGVSRLPSSAVRDFPEDTRRIALFDHIIGNHDRHLGNVVMDNNGRLVPIDHGGAFGYPDEYEVTGLGKEFANQPITDEEERMLAEAYDHDLHQYGLHEDEITGMRHRVETMLSNGRFLGRRYGMVR